MILTICFGNQKNAIGDGYKNLINSFSRKKNVICIHPVAYLPNEYSDEFDEIITESVTNSRVKYVEGVLFARKITELVKRKKIKVVFFYFDNHWMNFIIYLFLKNLNVKFIVWVHDPILHLGENKKSFIIRMFNNRIIFSNATIIIVSFSAALEQMKKAYNVSEERLTVINLPRMPEMEFEEINPGEKKYDFIFFGRLEAYKGIENLICAVDIHRKIKLLIVGRGKLDEQIKSMAIKMTNVDFVNEYVSNIDLAKYIASARWVILPYKSATGSQTIQIANYYNVPVLATRVGCFVEYIKEYENGLFIKDNNIENIISAMNVALNLNTEQMKKDMKKKLEERFSLKKVANELEVLFKV